MIEIVEYFESWPGEFQQIGRSLRAALGDLALRIDHIGSTSVPGLSAKDVIDVQVTLERLGEGDVAPLTAAGFVRGEGIWGDHAPPGSESSPVDWQKLFFNERSGHRRANIHIRAAGRSNQRFALLFRDYLRAHPRTASAYAELKRRLAVSLADSSAYPTVKDPAVDLIYLPAEEWAVTTNWMPGPSDA
jgi:GrpB-like predicted nucleotidyltransferase (UPF0157 family)